MSLQNVNLEDIAEQEAIREASPAYRAAAAAREQIDIDNEESKEMAKQFGWNQPGAPAAGGRRRSKSKRMCGGAKSCGRRTRVRGKRRSNRRR